jgi:DNA gyrase subunit A
LVHPDDEIMLITDRGVLVRTRVSEIRALGRATQGVTLIGLDEGSRLTGLQRILENDATIAALAEESVDDDGNEASGAALGTPDDGEPGASTPDAPDSPEVT